MPGHLYPAQLIKTKSPVRDISYSPLPLAINIKAPKSNPAYVEQPLILKYRNQHLRPIRQLLGSAARPRSIFHLFYCNYKADQSILLPSICTIPNTEHTQCLRGTADAHIPQSNAHIITCTSYLSFLNLSTHISRATTRRLYIILECLHYNLQHHTSPPYIFGLLPAQYIKTRRFQTSIQIPNSAARPYTTTSHLFHCNLHNTSPPHIIQLSPPQYIKATLFQTSIPILNTAARSDSSSNFPFTNSHLPKAS